MVGCCPAPCNGTAVAMAAAGRYERHCANQHNELDLVLYCVLQHGGLAALNGGVFLPDHRATQLYM